MLFRITLAQMMKLVIYAAVACAGLSPFLPVLPSGIEGVWASVVLSGTIVPLAWACVSFVLIRPGRTRDRVILLCLLVASITATGFTGTLCVTLLSQAYAIRSVEHVPLALVGLCAFFTAATNVLGARIMAWHVRPSQRGPSRLGKNELELS